MDVCSKEDWAVSSVVGTVTLLALTILLAVGVLWVVNIKPNQPRPNIGTTASISVQETHGNAVQVFKVKHTAGQAVSASQISFQLRGTTNTIRGPNIQSASVFSDGKWEPGEVLRIELSTRGICLDEDEKLKYTLIHNPSSSVISSTTVNVHKNISFAIIDNTTIKVNHGYNANISLLSTQLSGTSDAYDAIFYGPITARIRVGNTHITPWPDGNPSDTINGVTDDLNNPQRSEQFTYSTGNLSENTTLSVAARSWHPTGYYGTYEYEQVNNDYYRKYRASGLDSERITVNTLNNTETNLVLLRDGDTVPDFTSAGVAQQPLKHVLDKYTTNTGKLTLQDDQIIALLELSQHNASPSNASQSGDPDYNDAVFLIELQSTDTELISANNNPKPTVICSTG